jgi:hypothetical protein
MAECSVIAPRKSKCASDINIHILKLGPTYAGFGRDNPRPRKAHVELRCRIAMHSAVA